MVVWHVCREQSGMHTAWNSDVAVVRGPLSLRGLWTLDSSLSYVTPQTEGQIHHSPQWLLTISE